MFQIKICGIGSSSDALAAAAAGADALGLNFFPESSRCVAEEVADEIAASLPAGVAKVGLFVNADAARIVRLYERLQLDLIQLHGDEPPEFLAELEGRPVMKAFRMAATGLRPVREFLDRCQGLGTRPPVVLIDGFRAGQYGGTGATVDWPSVARWREEMPEAAVVLAGGLTPENVSRAIEIVRPVAVDTASGVESAPRVKDAARMRDFVVAAAAAFGRYSACQSKGLNLS